MQQDYYIFIKVQRLGNLSYNRPMAEKLYTLKEASEILGIPKHTLGRFCNSGLVPCVRRDQRGVRILTTEQLDLVDILYRMRRFGFKSKEIRRYSRLYRQDESIAKDRLAILTTRKHQLRQEIKKYQDAIDFIERQEEVSADKTRE